MKMELALRRCRCKYDGCTRRTRIMEKRDKRVDIREGFAHPECALRWIDGKITSFQQERKEFLKTYEIIVIEDTI